MSQNGTPTPWYRKPMWLGLVGLGLIVGGWKLTTFVPPSPASPQLAELRQMAPDREYAETLDRYAARASRDTPFYHAGRLAVLAGLAMFVVAAVQMYQSAPAPAPVEEPEPDLE
jgi:hypothetical protein